MGANSAIEWTDNTFNPWWGCQRVSPGCEHCYAETFDKRVHGAGAAHWGPKAARKFFGDKHWNEPRKWNAAAERTGVRQRVFCASMADVFEDLRELDDQRSRLWRLIRETPMLDWLLLTKRPENVLRLAPLDVLAECWVGTTVEDRVRLSRVDELRRVPARVLFLSVEPLLEDLGFLDPWWPRGIDWVIVGGESGPGARPMNPTWVRSIRDACIASGTRFFFKQWGDWMPVSDYSGPMNRLHTWSIGSQMMERVGKKSAGRELDGRTWDEVPFVVNGRSETEE